MSKRQRSFRIIGQVSVVPRWGSMQNNRKSDFKHESFLYHIDIHRVLMQIIKANHMSNNMQLVWAKIQDGANSCLWK